MIDINKKIQIKISLKKKSNQYKYVKHIRFTKLGIL